MLPKQSADFIARHHFDSRFSEAAGLVEQLAEELADYGIPDSLQHDDLHDGQVFVKDSRNLIMDWADSCITHPFVVLAVAVTGGISWGVDDVEDSENFGPYVTPTSHASEAPPPARRRDRDAPGLGLPCG